MLLLSSNSSVPMKKRLSSLWALAFLFVLPAVAFASSPAFTPVSDIYEIGNTEKATDPFENTNKAPQGTESYLGQGNNDRGIVSQAGSNGSLYVSSGNQSSTVFSTKDIVRSAGDQLYSDNLFSFSWRSKVVDGSGNVMGNNMGIGNLTAWEKMLSVTEYGKYDNNIGDWLYYQEAGELGEASRMKMAGESRYNVSLSSSGMDDDGFTVWTMTFLGFGATMFNAETWFDPSEADYAWTYAMLGDAAFSLDFFDDSFTFLDQAAFWDEYDKVMNEYYADENFDWENFDWESFEKELYDKHMLVAYDPGVGGGMYLDWFEVASNYGDTWRFDYVVDGQSAVTPEPASLVILGIGASVGGLAVARKRSRKNKK